MKTSTEEEETRRDILGTVCDIWAALDHPKPPEQKSAWVVNMRSFLRILLFDAFCLRLLFVPVGVRRGISHRRVTDGFVSWEYQQIHVFGIRVARWVLGAPRFSPDKEEAKVTATASVTAAWAHIEDPEKEPADEERETQP